MEVLPRRQLIDALTGWLRPDRHDNEPAGTKLETVLPWAANNNPPVNKRDLSTGETRDFATKIFGSGLNPGG